MRGRHIGSLVLGVGALAWPMPAAAQWVVTDPANLIQVAKIVETTIKHLERAIAIRDALERAGQKLGSMDTYRTIGLQAARHQTEKYPYAAAVLDALNLGDPQGLAYGSMARRIRLPPEVLAKMSPNARRVFETAQAAIQIADSINQRSIQVAGGGNGFAREIGRALLELEADILNPSDAMHGQTAVLDKLAGAGILQARQADGVNQQLATIVEQLLARSARERDTQAVSMNRRLNALEYGPAANRALMRDAGEAVRTWSQP